MNYNTIFSEISNITSVLKEIIVEYAYTTKEDIIDRFTHYDEEILKIKTQKEKYCDVLYEDYVSKIKPFKRNVFSVSNQGSIFDDIDESCDRDDDENEIVRRIKEILLTINLISYSFGKHNVNFAGPYDEAITILLNVFDTYDKEHIESTNYFTGNSSYDFKNEPITCDESHNNDIFKYLEWVRVIFMTHFHDLHEISFHVANVKDDKFLKGTFALIIDLTFL